MKQHRKLLALTMSSVMACAAAIGVAPQMAYAAGSLPEMGADTASMTNDELFAGYVDQLFSVHPSTVSVQARNAKGSESLNVKQKAIYKQLANHIKHVASGMDSETTFRVVGDIDLMDDGRIYDALICDLPYELYWHDKTVGTQAQGNSTSFTVSFAVASAYSAGAYTTDRGKTYAATMAKRNADDIVANYKGKTTAEQLTGFRNEICERTEYNDDAARGGVAYGDPWQMIYVFDNDSATTVVCEGYAKAFQYLCDASGINSTIVTGSMSAGTGAGDHMWNLVTISGENYLVDVTNCDTGTVGYPDKLFMKGAANGTAYGYTVCDTTYTYDTDTTGLFSSTQLTLSKTDYDGGGSAVPDPETEPAPETETEPAPETEQELEPMPLPEPTPAPEPAPEPDPEPEQESTPAPASEPAEQGETVVNPDGSTTTTVVVQNEDGSTTRTETIKNSINVVISFVVTNTTADGTSAVMKFVPEAYDTILLSEIRSASVGTLVIPTTVTDSDGRVLTVDGMAGKIFSGLRGVGTVVIPDTVTSFDNKVFAKSGISSVEIAVKKAGRLNLEKKAMAKAPKDMKVTIKAKNRKQYDKAVKKFQKAGGQNLNYMFKKLQ